MRQHPQTANAPKIKKRQELGRAQVRAPADEVAAWMAAAAAQGRSLNNWLRRVANEAAHATENR